MVSKRGVFPVLVSTAVLCGLLACGGGADCPDRPSHPAADRDSDARRRHRCRPRPFPRGWSAPRRRRRSTASNVKFQVGTRGRKTLDSRPQVINMNGYCESVGFGGFFCFTRREGDPQAEACDYMAMGQASDTGRWGPDLDRGRQAVHGEQRHQRLPEPPGEPVPGHRQGGRRLPGLCRRLHSTVDGSRPAGQSVRDLPHRERPERVPVGLYRFYWTS